MNSDETWKDVAGYEGKYQVSNLGRVRSLHSMRGCFQGSNKRENRKRYDVREIRPISKGNGYQYVTLHLNGVRKNFYVHRLVATAFIPNKEGKPEVNHKDYNKQNNKADNLEWLTRLENTRYSSCNKRKQSRNSITNTGERYITRRSNGDYRVIIKGKEKGFYSLDDAIEYRNRRANEVGYTV